MIKSCVCVVILHSTLNGRARFPGGSFDSMHEGRWHQRMFDENDGLFTTIKWPNRVNRISVLLLALNVCNWFQFQWHWHPHNVPNVQCSLFQRENLWYTSHLKCAPWKYKMKIRPIRLNKTANRTHTHTQQPLRLFANAKFMSKET